MAGNTSNKSVRFPDELWTELGVMTHELGMDRSKWLTEAVRWGLRKPGARLPQRKLERPAEGEAS